MEVSATGLPALSRTTLPCQSPSGLRCDHDNRISLFAPVESSGVEQTAFFPRNLSRVQTFEKFHQAAPGGCHGWARNSPRRTRARPGHPMPLWGIGQSRRGIVPWRRPESGTKRCWNWPGQRRRSVATRPAAFEPVLETRTGTMPEPAAGGGLRYEFPFPRSSRREKALTRFDLSLSPLLFGRHVGWNGCFHCRWLILQFYLLPGEFDGVGPAPVLCDQFQFHG